MLALSEAFSESIEVRGLFDEHKLALWRLPVAVSGLPHIGKAQLIAAVHRLSDKNVLVVTGDEADSAKAADDVSSLAGKDVRVLPAGEFNLRGIETASRDFERQRLAVLNDIAGNNAKIVVAAADALIQRTAPPEELKNSVITLKPSLPMKQEELIGRLAGLGYKREYSVEAEGQFAVRGGIVDIYPAESPNPYRVEFYGDEIDTVSSFELESQRRIEALKRAEIIPAADTFMSSRSSDASGRFTCALDYLRKDTIVVMYEQARIVRRMDAAIARLAEEIASAKEDGKAPDEKLMLEPGEFWHALSKFSTIQADDFTPSSHKVRPKSMFTFACKQLPSFGGSIDTAINDIAHYRKAGYGVAVFCHDAERAGRLRDLLEDHNIIAGNGSLNDRVPRKGEVILTNGRLSAGAEYPELKLAVITEGSGSLRKVRHVEYKPKKRDKATIINSCADLKPGDLVVHDHHGIARFVGVDAVTIDGVTQDYAKLSYAGGDAVFVPVMSMQLISKYIGGGYDENGESKVKLNKLNSPEWHKTKSRVKSAVKDLAKQLTVLYAERERRPGFAFPKDDPWQAGFEDAFPYAETEDQLRCAAEIKRDMERPRPMDRLLCGDVGFGKTEVAFRAVMKCVLGGKQAAMLCPTTVLANQHYLTALKRFEKYPVRVETLSRFRSPEQVKETIERLRTGRTDFVIGTHRLLQKDIKFRDPGLVIVDEEQRFGVGHKERLKEMAKQVDSLTLTATPIPRTLNMALSGIRDMSTLEEAPSDRLPVRTFVLEHNPGILLDAVRREVGRGGQVYWLHNRIETIDREAAKLKEQLPDVSVSYAHGQMDERSLADVMGLFNDGEIQVLVCTTIIEAGIDIPNVNTLIVTDADRFGLSQLHQLRGRVGRSPRPAYAYFTFKQGKVLTEVASKRLDAMREFAEFGAGFKIAMRDLEIRGAGNVLGAEQSGQMINVGYDLYLRMLREAVLEEQGQPARTESDCLLDLTINAIIPDTYIVSGGMRMDFYRRIAEVGDPEGMSDMIDELADRFGEVPKQIDALLRAAVLRHDAGKLGIREIRQNAGYLRIKPDPQDFRAMKLATASKYAGKSKISKSGEDYVVSVKLSGDPLAEARELVNEWARL